MPYQNKISREEYEKINKVSGSGKAGSGREDYEKAKVLQSAISKVRGLQTYRPPVLFDGPYRINVRVHGRTRADEDNIRKAINDAIQGVATRNDRDSIGGSIELCRS